MNYKWITKEIFFTTRLDKLKEDYTVLMGGTDIDLSQLKVGESLTIAFITPSKNPEKRIFVNYYERLKD